MDAFRLREGLQVVPSDLAAEIVARAREQCAEYEADFPALRRNPSLDNWDDGDIDRLVTAFQERPCPALQEDGACGLYAWRPLTCRLTGTPVDDGTTVHGACGVQTFVPILRSGNPARKEAGTDSLVDAEAATLAAWATVTGRRGEELLLPYGFLTE